ncbi:MAG: leucine-rich repeat protein, partial [Clostridia bacterium]|nr:leucine-rich repeat protein [Clostridia bacterium]
DFEEGLADYSYMDSFAGTNLYINVSNIPSKLHLPANITTIDAKMLSGTYGRGNMKAIWCGNTAEPTEGTIDLTGADITSIGNLAFDDLTALDTLILPDSVSSLTKEMFTDSDTLYIKTVKQAAYQADIAAFCIENSINYFTLTGEPNVAPAQ